MPTPATCPKCGRPKVSCEIGVVGFPDHRVAGSYREHCTHCDGPLTATLNASDPSGRTVLEPRGEVTMPAQPRHLCRWWIRFRPIPNQPRVAEAYVPWWAWLLEGTWRFAHAFKQVVRSPHPLLPH